MAISRANRLSGKSRAATKKESTNPEDVDEENDPEEDSEIDPEQDEEESDTKERPHADRVARQKSRRPGSRPVQQGERPPVIRLAKDSYDPEEDWEVEHSGTDDPNGGPPRYDESPIKGGMIIASNHLHMQKGEIVNAMGHEIDPDELDDRGFGKVKDPDRYKNEEDSL